MSIKNTAILLMLLIAFNSIVINATPASDISEVGNINPTIDLNVTPVKKSVDIVIVTDYTGTKLTDLNTQINNLKAQFSTVNADPAFHILSSVRKVGTQRDELRTAYRNAYYNYQINHERYYSPGSGWNDLYYEWYQKSFPWESMQVLLSQISQLPVRNPQNVTFTKSALIHYKSENIQRDYYNVQVKCTNDVKSASEIFELEKMYESFNNGSESSWDYLMSENATVDSEWTISTSGTDVSYDVYSLDFDKLYAVPLRSGSDRHMIFISDGYAKDYSKTLGNYFSFGDMTTALKSYICTNKFSLHGVLPDAARYKTLLMDKVTNIVPMGNTTLFKMEDGKTLMSAMYSGIATHVEAPVNADDIKDTVVRGNSCYMLLRNGTIKYYDDADSEIKTIEGITNAAKIYGFKRTPYLHVLDSNGKVYAINNGGSVEAYNNSVTIGDIIQADENYWTFITPGGELYVETETRNTSTNVTVKHLLTRAQIKSGTSVRDLPAIKDVTSFTSESKRNSLNPVLALYANGQIQQFERILEVSATSGLVVTKTPYFIEDTVASLLETDVRSIDSNGNCIFVFKNDGTIKMLNNAWIIDTYTNNKDKEVSYDRPMLKNALINVPLNNIQKTYRTDMERYFFVDDNNNTYMYAGGWKAPSPVLGSTLKNIGSNICKIRSRVNSSNSTYGYVYLICNDGTVGQLTSKYDNYIADGFFKWTQYSTISALPISNVLDVYTLGAQEYFLKDDGRVFYMVSSNYVECFSNNLVFDKTKAYVSFLDIFNSVSDAVFYNQGAYASAFNDIYKRYSSNSSGNMFVLLGDEIKYETVYDDYENDPEYSRKWIIAHDAYYFDNGMGLSAYHNPTGAAINPPTKLDKVGKYTINLYARDNPKTNNLFNNYRLWSLGNHDLTVYIHRRPIAMLKLTITNNGNGTYTVAASDAGSYDPDHSNSRTDKGIVAREWRWKESNSTEWANTQMNKSDCDPENSYVVQLRVKDAEGVWSDYDTATIDRNNPPVALFSLDKTVIRDTEALKVKDQSFPQSFSTIEKWHWIVKKLNTDSSVPAANLQNAQFINSNAGTGALAGYDGNVKTNFAANGAGTYRIYLRVKDSNGLWSDSGSDATTPADLSKFYSMDLVVDKAPTASFTVANSVIRATDLLRIKDTTTTAGISPVTKWHWIVKKLNADGSVPSANLQSEIFTDHNAGTGPLAGYDTNVKTDYSTFGAGTYRIYLRAANGYGMWSDGGTDSVFTLSGFFYRDIIVDSPPTASFAIAKNPIEPSELLKLKDTSVKTGVSPIAKWHWIVKKLNADGSEPASSLQDEQFTASNKGTGSLTGYDANVETDYSKEGPGTYRIYLRVQNGSGMWSDGGTDSVPKPDSCFHRDLLVQEAYKLVNFRVVKIKDLNLSSFYYNPGTGQYDDRPMGVNTMAVDCINFNNTVDGLTKGYIFEFEIDTVNFNGSNDTIEIIPGFYTCDNNGRDPEERDLYWEDSYHLILKAGEGGHAEWAKVSLKSENRLIRGENNATWRGSYLIPGTAWAVPWGTSSDNAVAKRLDRDIIVHFEIKGYKDGIMKFDYNLKQWPAERAVSKYPYEVGDVIRYSYKKNNLEDIGVILNRP